MHDPISARARRLPTIATVLFSASVLNAQGPDVGKALADFAHRPNKEQEAIATALHANLAALDLPGLKSLRAAAAAAAQPATAHTKAFPRREPKQGGSKPQSRRADELELGVHYVFGIGIVEPVAATKPAKATEQAAGRRHQLQAALLGVPTETDAAVAALLAALDRDRSADRFAAFLESWRNGDESFYEALDRTAGTKDSVFFYDVMLHDFTSAFAPKGDGATSGLQAAHDALHEGFLAYRQYRAFREAIAWSCVLPPDIALPAHLQRYETPVAGAFSLREQVTMLLATLDWDTEALAGKVGNTAPPMPDPLWHGGYDPYPRWNELYAAALPKMIAEAGDTDTFLRRSRAVLGDRATAIRAAAAQALAAHTPPR